MFREERPESMICPGAPFEDQYILWREWLYGLATWYKQSSTDSGESKSQKE